VDRCVLLVVLGAPLLLLLVHRGAMAPVGAPTLAAKTVLTDVDPPAVCNDGSPAAYYLSLPPATRRKNAPGCSGCRAVRL
jgi:hypothetical protein